MVENLVKDWTQQIESHGIARVLAKRKELSAALKATMQEMDASHDEMAVLLRAAGDANDAAKKAFRECRFDDCESLVAEGERLHDAYGLLKKKQKRLDKEFWLYHDSIKALDEATGGLCECCWKQKHEVNHG